jgi:hypothetical protein
LYTVPNSILRGAPPLSKLALKQGRLNPLIWLTVMTLAFLPAGYFFKDTWLADLLVCFPVGAYLITLAIGWYWAIRKPDLLLSEENELARILANIALTESGPILVGKPVGNPSPPGEQPAKENG